MSDKERICNEFNIINPSKTLISILEFYELKGPPKNVYYYYHINCYLSSLRLFRMHLMSILGQKWTCLHVNMQSDSLGHHWLSLYREKCNESECWPSLSVNNIPSLIFPACKRQQNVQKYITVYIIFCVSLITESGYKEEVRRWDWSPVRFLITDTCI